MRRVLGRHERKGGWETLPSNWGCLGANCEISDSEKYILVDPGDRFAMDNGENKNILRSDREVWTPRPFPWIRPCK